MDIIIGNVLTVIAMIFMLFAVSQKDNKKLIIIQGVSHFFFAISGIVLKGYSGVVQDVIGFVRNLAISKRFINKSIRIFLLTAGVVFGITLNNKGLIGVLPIVGTFQYTLVSTDEKSQNKTVQLSIIVNSILMIFYSIAINNYANIMTNSLIIIFSLKTIRESRNM